MAEGSERKSKGGHELRAGAHYVVPETLVEVGPGFVLAARLDRSKARVRRFGLARVEESAIEPLLARPNVLKLDAARQAVAQAVERTGSGGDSLGFLLPDGALRVAPLSMETIPDKPSEAVALAAWKMKDSLPFGPDEARISYQVIAKKEKEYEVLAVAGRQSVLAEYESLTEGMNNPLVMIVPSTLALLALLPEAEGAQMLQHASGQGVTTVLIEGGQIRLWRHLRLDNGSNGDPTGAIASEAARVLASARDRMVLEVRRVWLCARPALGPGGIEELSRAAGCEFEELRADGGLAASSLAPEEMKLFAEYGAPIAGAIVNGK